VTPISAGGAGPTRIPRATYRVQLHAGFTFDDATAILPYLAELGISHLYTSPVLQAVQGSTHGYDVVDHSRVSDELGGEAGFERLTDALRAHGMGLVLDIVPNHMAIGEENRWWWDVLEYGRTSRYADYFDIDWEYLEPRLRGAMLLPVLADHYGVALEAGDIRLVRDGGRVLVAYGDRRFPLDPMTAAAIATDDDLTAINGDADRMDALLAVQHWRLAHWRAASEDLGYRRFFDVDSLIGLRMERPEVFRETHERVLRWVADGRVEGLRIDHPDGLRDPAAYFDQLRAEAPNAWIVAEKILEPDEALPAGWAIHGTTGYRFANLATGLLVDPRGEPGMDAAWTAAADVGPGWDAIVAAARREVLDSLLGSDLNRLAARFLRVCEADRRHRDHTRRELREALREVAAAVGVYRTYVRPGEPVAGADAGIIDAALALAADRRPDLDPELLALLGRILRLEVDAPLARDLAARFQQLTPAAMAKGVEDTAVYRHHRLVALNEVGGDPGRFGTSVDEFHRSMKAAQAEWPLAMLALSTHDTKRSADVRARLALLSEDPPAWAATVERLSAASAPHRASAAGPTPADAYLFFQIVIGAWPISAERAAGYLEKASREAKLRTSWTAPDAGYEDALTAFVHGCLADALFVAGVEAAVTPLVDPGRRGALAQLALQLTAPGVPDVYQGSELWELSLVDPDNRRPVDYALRRRMLEETRDMTASQAWSRRDEGVPKLWLLWRALELRRRRPDAFGPDGGYRALRPTGERAPAMIAFARGEAVVTVVPRRLRHVAEVGWGDTTVTLPEGRWRGLDGVEHAGAPLVRDLLDPFPVAILEREHG